MTLVAPLGPDDVAGISWGLYVRDDAGVDVPELQAASGRWRVDLAAVVERMSLALRLKWLAVIDGWIELDELMARPVPGKGKDSAPRLKHALIARERRAAAVAAATIRASLEAETERRAG